MAKKKDKEVTESLSIVDSVVQSIKKTYGDVCKTSEDIVNEGRKIISISPRIDMGLNGGILEGICVTLSGKEGSGKTTTALSAAANAQKMGKVVYYISVEGRIEVKNLQGIYGLDTDPKKLVIIQSTEDHILNGNDFLGITQAIINQHPGAFIIFDSISAICDEQEASGGVNYQARGSSAKLASTFSRQMAQTLRVNKTVLILIAHLQVQQGTGMSYLDEKVAGTTKYLTSLQMKIKRFEKWEEGGDQIGQILEWEVKKNPLGPPRKIHNSYLRYGKGLDRVAELCGLAEEYGLIDESGAWYVVDFLQDKPKVQGEAKLHKLFNDSEEYLTLLESEIKKYSENLNI